MHKITKLICFRKLRQYFLLIIILANIFTSIAFFSNNLQFQSTKSDCIDSIEFNSLERKNPVHSGTIDSPLIINEPFSSLINQKKIIDVDEDKALYAYNLTLSQINQTKNMVENSQMDNDIDNLLKHWTMKSTSNKTNGLQLEYAQLDDNMVLNFSINGSEGNEIFSPFKNNNYTEFFYDCDSWEINYINSSTNFNLSCTEDSIFDSPDSKMGSSKMVSSKISNLFPTKNETYSSELNHTFFYNGSLDILDSTLQFKYQLNNQSIDEDHLNISVYLSNPDGERIQLDNWYDDVGNSEGFGHFRTKIFNSEILLPILDQNGEYSIIFRFEHSFKEDTFGPFFNSIYLDQVKFYINYTAKEIYPNETITITQEIENYNEILEDSLLSSQIRSNISFPELNFDNWSFWVSVNQYSLKNYSLNSFPDNNWFFESSPIPKEELSSKNITLSFNLHYNGTEVLRFNKSDSWSLFFDNVSLISNLSYNWSDISEYVDFYNFKDSPTFNLHRTQFLTNKNHPSGAKYPYFYISKNQSLPDVWLSSLLPKILFNSSQDFLSEPIEFQGNLQKIHLSWRDFLYNNVKGLISQLDGYFSLIQSEIVYGIDEWDDLLRLHSLFEDISTLNLDNLLIKSYLLDPSLPRPITSYIQYIELNSQLSVQTFGDFAKNIFEQSSASNLTRKTRIIRDVVNSTFNSTIKDYNSVLSSLLSSISQIPLETIPEGLNISKMYFLLQNIRSQITNNKLNEGFSFFLKDDYYEFPSLVFYRNLANNMEQNLKSNFFNNLDDSTNFFPFEWLWENNLDAEFHFGMNKNNSKIPQGIPVLFTESYSSFPASNLTFSTLNLPMVYFHSLSLFHSLFISFDSLVKINNLFDHFTNLTNIVNISISEMEIIDKESFCKNLFSDEDSIVFNTFDLNHNLYSDLDYYIGDVKTPIYLEHKINLSFTPLLLSTANSQSQTLLKTEIFLPIFEPQISTKYIKAQTINNEINVSKIDFSNEFISFPSTIQDTLTTLIFLQGNFSVGDFLQAPIIKTSIIVDNEIVFQNSTSFHVLSLSSSLSQENIEEIYNKETLIKSLNYNLQSKQYKFISLPILPMRSSFHIDWLQGEPHTVAIFNIINAVSSNNLNISSLSVSIEDSSYSNSLGSYVFSTQKIQNCPYYQFQINFGRLDTIITGSNIENQNLIVKIIMEAENLVENEIIFDEIIFSAYYYPPLTTKDPVIATRMIVFLISLMCIAAIFVIMNIYHRFIKKTMIMDD